MAKQRFSRQSMLQHLLKITVRVWENGTGWDEPPWVGGGLEGAVGYKSPHASALWWKEVSFPGGCFCSPSVSLYQQLCTGCLQGERFSKPASLQRPVNGKRAAFKTNRSQPHSIHSDALKLLRPRFSRSCCYTISESVFILSKSKCKRAISVTSTMLQYFSKLQLFSA